MKQSHPTGWLSTAETMTVRMKEVAVSLPEATYNRLRAFAARTGRSATFHIREAIEQHHEDLEDSHAAETALIEHRKSGERTLSLDELERCLHANRNR